MTILPSQRLRRARPLPAAGLLLLLLAGTASAEDFQLDNVRLDLGQFVLTIPKLDVKGTSLDRAAFQAIFQAAPGSNESPVARMSRLTATEISAPSLVMEQNFGPQKQITTYRDIRFSEIREGKIARGEAKAGTIKVEGSTTGQMNGEILRTSFEGLDLTQIARVFAEKAAPGTEPAMQTVIGRIEQDGYTLDLGELGKVSGGKAAMRNFKARVGAEPMGELMTRIVTLGEESEKAAKDLNSKEEPAVTEARDRQMLLATLALFDSIDYGSGEIRDLVMAIKTPPKPGAKPEAVDLRISRIAFGEDAPEKSGLVMEGLKFEGGGGKGAIASAGYFGFSLENTIKELRKALAEPDFDPSADDLRRFIPKLGTIRLSGIQITAPQEGKRGAAPLPPIEVGLGTFELRHGEQVNGIPTNMALTLDKLTIPVVESASNPSAKDLLAMGYRTLDLSAKLDLAWQEASKEFAIRALSLGGAGMAKLEATGTLGNVGKEVFSADLALAQVALLGATAKNLDIKLQNLGLAEKLIENEARKSKRKVEDVRREYGTIASLGLAAILGPSDGAKALASAIARFVAKPGLLSVSATAKAPNGLGLADVITLADPTEIFEKIDVKANAE
ncbi:hypothetical protein DK26_18355 [Bosea sp. WAO]|uniref:hypothetical protein n=1 Tax=Bosea sp. WAO TaxID=406341 RepID=UPI00074AF951|nr:hypothetical protein [Bosea sp. WAO]KUL94822.1 hypothetical protein DK26_18355 [Bosea sp. WAO]